MKSRTVPLALQPTTLSTAQPRPSMLTAPELSQSEARRPRPGCQRREREDGLLSMASYVERL
jgi:hypothetical protein